MYDLYNETGYKIRCMDGLIVQIKKDYAELNQLWKKLERGAVASSEMEEFVRVFSWLREELSVFDELRRRGIEGVTWGELEDIERDVKEKEMDLWVSSEISPTSNSRSASSFEASSPIR